MRRRRFVFKAAGINRLGLLGVALLSISSLLLIGFELEVRAQSPATILVFTGWAIRFQISHTIRPTAQFFQTANSTSKK
jgi:hypothetical protein